MNASTGDAQAQARSATSGPAARPLNARSLFRELDRVVGDLQRGGGMVQRPDRHPPVVADAVHQLAQRLADAAADARGEPRQTVPRLADHALPDQLQVVARELSEAAQDTGAVDIDAVRRSVDDVRGLMLRGVPR